MSSQKSVSYASDSLPIVPETRAVEPLVQCGVLYLGSAPTSPGLRALDSIQEPFSHRYPVDGTNTVRGIDAVLSIYDNGIQLAFTRQPHAVIFFPIVSLVYCASVQFTTVAHDQTSLVDWRFMPLDRLDDAQTESKHPPLFCAVIHRTHIIPGDECHCFITKSAEASLALVQSITQTYTDLSRDVRLSRSPVFYQLDRFGRKLSEINGVIYLTPANEDQSLQKKKRTHHEEKSLSIKDYLTDPSLDGFFYRTNASLIESWQLWDDDDQYRSRPRPPASPFGLHQGLYHDDMTEEIQRYLRRMEEEDESCSTCPDSTLKSSSTSRSFSSSISSCSSSRTASTKQSDVDENTDQFDQSLTNLQVSSFEPEPMPSRPQNSSAAPIVIEKKIPRLPILKPILPKTRSSRKERPLPLETKVDCVSSSDPFSIDYQINERGEKITKDGNRLIYMDVIRPTLNQNGPEAPIYPSKSSIQRRSTHIPVLDLESLQNLFSKREHRRRSVHLDEQSKDRSIPERRSLTTTDLFRTIDQDSRHSSLSTAKRSLHNSSPIGHQPSISSRSCRSEKSAQSVEKHKIYPQPPVLTNEQLNQFVSTIYGAAGSIRSSSRSTNHRKVSASSASSIRKAFQATPQPQPTYPSDFRYVQSSINPYLLGEYRQVGYY